MVDVVSRRLPGIAFKVESPPLTDILPRMDVAVFVGFAASGPVHMPTLVEDAAAFSAVFGADVVLAWDAERGEVVYGYLAAAVRAFFRNGGRRCWIVRVPRPRRDASFDADLFLDCRLADTGTASLTSEADFLRYQSAEETRLLKGIHAALEVEEATLIAVPDAVHRGWSRFAPEPPPPAEESPPPIRPQWWHFLDCQPPPQFEAVRQPRWGHFLPCPLRVLPAPELAKEEGDGVVTLTWSRVN